MNKKIFSITILTPLFCIFFLVNALCVGQNKTLKIKPIFNFSYKFSRDEFKKSMVPLLEKNGIVFVDHNPDVILICGSPLKNMHTLKQPHIFLDEAESASIPEMRRVCLRNPYTIAVFKNTTLRPKYLYNQPIIYHFKLIKDGFSASQKIKYASLSQTEQQKIRSVLWDTYRSAFKNNLQPLTELNIDFDAERPVDVFFAGTINGNNPPGRHRANLLKKLTTIKKFKIVAHKGRLPKNDYFDLLKNSKIAISPWGNGEWCWRDYEAIYSGAIVIKPDTSFVQAVPDLYHNNKYYVACNPDFSDLEEKISYVIENYQQFIDMRKNARKLLIDHWDHEKIAQDLAHEIRQAFKKYNLSQATKKKLITARLKSTSRKKSIK